MGGACRLGASVHLSFSCVCSLRFRGECIQLRRTTRSLFLHLVLLPLSLVTVRTAFSAISIQMIVTIVAVLCLALPVAAGCAADTSPTTSTTDARDAADAIGPTDAESKRPKGPASNATDATGARDPRDATGARDASRSAGQARKRADEDELGIFAESPADDARQLEAVALLTEAVAKGLVSGRTQPLLDLVAEGQITDVLLREATQRWGLSQDQQARLAVGLVEGWRRLAGEMARGVQDAFPHLMPPRAEQGHIVATVRFDLPEARNYLLFRYRPSSRGPRLVNIEYPLLGMDLVNIMLTRMPRHKPPRHLPDPTPRGQAREVATKTAALLFALVAIAWAVWRRITRDSHLFDN